MKHSAEDARAANAVARAVAAEAGSGPTDTIVAGCGLVRFGLFFDGTDNSRDHVGGERWHTNVDLLERIYRLTDEDGPQTETIEGRPRKVRYMREYMRGIGVTEGGGWMLDGQAWGTGPEGVESRVKEAIGKALDMIHEQAGDVQPCDIWFDLMGFSRGACAARYFAIRVKDGAIDYNGARTTTKVMALFDTVSSIGHGGNTGNYSRTHVSRHHYSVENVRINTDAGAAETIIHLTAKDEIRKNFPLTLARFGTRIEMIGAHADIGGGYAPTQITHKLAEVHGMTYSGVIDFCKERWTSSNQTIVRAFAPNTPSLTRLSTYTITTTTEPGLQFVALRVMHTKCVEAGMPLRKELGDNINGISISMPAELQAYYSAVVTNRYEAVRAMEKDIRSKYGHFSARNVGVRDKLAHLPVPEARRVVDTL